jgi:hypothetical protein
MYATSPQKPVPYLDMGRGKRNIVALRDLRLSKKTIAMEAPTFLTEDQLWHKSDSYWFKRRADFIEAFIDEIRDPVGDMGEENPLIRYLGHKKDMAYTSIDDVDFDYEPIKGKFRPQVGRDC